jgi:hypothetical protein
VLTVSLPRRRESLRPTLDFSFHFGSRLENSPSS